MEGVTKLVPDAWLIRTCQWIVGEGQRPAVRQALANHGLFHANQYLVYRRNLIVTISDEAWNGFDDRDTKKWLCKWPVSPSSPLRTTARSFVFTKVDGLLAEVQADWEDRRIFLPSKPLAGTTGFILNLQPNQQKGLFLPIDDVSSRNRFLQSSPSSSRALPALFGGDSLPRLSRLMMMEPFMLNSQRFL